MIHSIQRIERNMYLDEWKPNTVNTFHFVRIRKFPFWRMILSLLCKLWFIDKQKWQIESQKCMFLSIPFRKIGKFHYFFPYVFYNLFCSDAPFAGYHIRLHLNLKYDTCQTYLVFPKILNLWKTAETIYEQKYYL